MYQYTSKLLLNRYDEIKLSNQSEVMTDVCFCTPSSDIEKTHSLSLACAETILNNSQSQ